MQLAYRPIGVAAGACTTAHKEIEKGWLARATVILQGRVVREKNYR